MKTVKLKPCPFCGGRAEIVSRRSLTDRISFIIKCTNPKCVTKPCTFWEHSPMAVAEAWNRRAI